MTIRVAANAKKRIKAVTDKKQWKDLFHPLLERPTKSHSHRPFFWMQVQVVSVGMLMTSSASNKCLIGYRYGYAEYTNATSLLSFSLSIILLTISPTLYPSLLYFFTIPSVYTRYLWSWFYWRISADDLLWCLLHGVYGHLDLHQVEYQLGWAHGIRQLCLWCTWSFWQLSFECREPHLLQVRHSLS